MSEFFEIITVFLVMIFLIPVVEILWTQPLHVCFFLLTCLILRILLKNFISNHQFLQVVDLLSSFILCFLQFETKCGIIFIVYLVLRSQLQPMPL